LILLGVSFLNAIPIDDQTQEKWGLSSIFKPINSVVSSVVKPIVNPIVQPISNLIQPVVQPIVNPINNLVGGIPILGSIISNCANDVTLCTAGTLIGGQLGPGVAESLGLTGVNQLGKK
jgi:hypothetical protein